MPPIEKYSRDDVISAALALLRKEGPSALNARSVAKQMGSSTQPIFRLFSGMEELQSAVICRASETFYRQMFVCMDESSEPHIAMGIHYVAYAEQEPELFKLLFLRDRLTAPDEAADAQERAAYQSLYERIARSLGVTPEQAEQLFLRCWVYTHGLATSVATKYSPCLAQDEVERLLHESWAAAAHMLNIA